MDDAGTAVAGDVPLPAGTVTFLFTDIEGSSVRWERFGPLMSAAIRRHDAILEQSVSVNGGRVFKTAGDGVYAAFSQAADALSAAVDAQRELQKVDWSDVGGIAVRMAIHAGAVESFGADYLGASLNRVARLLALANGGQVLLSEVAAALVQDALPQATSLRDLGQHRLKDLARSEHVYQAVAIGVADERAPVRSLSVVPNNLPRLSNPLIGREGVLHEIELLCERHRIVTVAGAGGVGKTRIALAVAAGLASSFAEGAWLVELAAVAESESVASAILRALGAAEAPEREPLATLAAHLRDRPMLIVLDNCEQVIEQTARIAHALIGQLPQLRMLVTSRESLRIHGECVYRLPSLEVPRHEEKLNVEQAMHYDAVKLFRERARAADSSFEITDENAGAVTELCRRLDGIPLAIELAATRIKIMPVRTLVAKIDERFRLIGGGRRSDAPRQQTLYNMIEWSYNLLLPRERALFERLAVFVDAFTLEAAIEVCSDGELDEFAVIESLESLIDKSLVSVEGPESERRCRLLESNRAFALERGDRQTGLALRHAGFARLCAQRLNGQWATLPTSAWERRVDEDIADIRAALRWSLFEANAPAVGIAIASELARFWSDMAPNEGRAALDAAAAAWSHVEIPAADEAKLLIADAMLSLRFRALERMLQRATAAQSAFALIDDELGIAMALRLQAHALDAMGRPDEAVGRRNVALEKFSALKNDRFVALTLWGIANNERLCGNLEPARQTFSQGLQLAIASGYTAGIPIFEINLAELEFELGNTQEAIALAESLLKRTYRSTSEVPALTRANLAGYYAQADRWDDCREFALAAARQSQQEEDRAARGLAIQHLALFHAHEGDSRRAAQLLGWVQHEFEAIHYKRERNDERLYRRLLDVIGIKLTARETEAALSEGKHVTLEGALALAASATSALQPAPAPD